MKSVSLAPSSGIHTHSHSSNVPDDYGIEKKANKMLQNWLIILKCTSLSHVFIKHLLCAVISIKKFIKHESCAQVQQLQKVSDFPRGVDLVSGPVSQFPALTSRLPHLLCSSMGVGQYQQSVLLYLLLQKKRYTRNRSGCLKKSNKNHKGIN